jgi:hypothetical protein
MYRQKTTPKYRLVIALAGTVLAGCATAEREASRPQASDEVATRAVSPAVPREALRPAMVPTVTIACPTTIPTFGLDRQTDGWFYGTTSPGSLTGVQFFSNPPYVQCVYYLPNYSNNRNNVFAYSRKFIDPQLVNCRVSQDQTSVICHSPLRR